MSYNAIDLARYIISKCSKEQCPISNLQLQKILYYIQVEWLSKNNEPLFNLRLAIRARSPRCLLLI